MFDFLTKQIEEKKIREKIQTGLYDEYLIELKKIPSYAVEEEINLADKIFQDYWHLYDDTIIEKIWQANKKNLVPQIAYCIDEIDLTSCDTPNNFIWPKDWDSNLTKNPYFTKIELILLGENSARNIIINWGKIKDKDYNFSSYIKNNEKIVRTKIIECVKHKLDDIYFDWKLIETTKN